MYLLVPFTYSLNSLECAVVVAYAVVISMGLYYITRYFTNNDQDDGSTKGQALKRRKHNNTAPANNTSIQEEDTGVYDIRTSVGFGIIPYSHKSRNYITDDNRAISLPVNPAISPDLSTTADQYDVSSSLDSTIYVPDEIFVPDEIYLHVFSYLTATELAVAQKASLKTH